MHRRSDLESQLIDLGPDLIVHWYREVSTTMEVAKEVIPEVIRSGRSGLVVADRQTAGKGRQGRSWENSEENIAATWVLPFSRGIGELAGFSLAVGVGVARALKEFGCNISLKWPNDLLSNAEGNHKKIGGILIETEETQGKTIVNVGIGINIIGYPKEVVNSGSILELYNIRPKRIELLTGISKELLKILKIFSTAHGFKGLKDEWLSLSVFNECLVSIDTGSEIISGRFSGVSDTGVMFVTSEIDGRLRQVVSGHVVSWKREN